MRKLMHSLASVILLATPATLKAQGGGENPFNCYISFGQNIALNHSLSATGSPWSGPGSYQAEFGIEFLHTQSTLIFRPNAGYTRMLSKAPDVIYYSDTGIPTYESLYDMLGVYVGFDLVWNASKRLPITFTIGPSFHAWSVERQAVPIAERNMGQRSLKLGVRMGFGYEITKKYRVDLTYTMTEWRSDSRGLRPANPPNTSRPSDYGPGYIEGLNPSTPSYFTVKGTYTF
jgi:hypothetical protein